MERRVGLIVPSSNVTIETELPRILARHPVATFSFHGSRARMREVTVEQLAEMNTHAARCAVEVSDAAVDVILYGCLVALISQGDHFYRTAERTIAEAAEANGCGVPVLSSAGALVSGLRHLAADRVAIVTPYMKPLTARLVGFLAAHDIEVVDSISLCVADNTEVGRLDPGQLPVIADRLNVSRAKAVVLSACVQMPSLSALETVEERLGLPTLSAATASAHEVLLALGLSPEVTGAGGLLDRRPSDSRTAG